MRFTIGAALVALLAVDGAVASSWFGRTAYNKWHQTELERWLDDNGVPYPTPADRKDLENLIKDNWNDKVVAPYNSWDLKQLQNYLSTKGEEVQKGAEKNKESLVAQVKSSWADTADKSNEAYSSVSDWIFDSWTESQLKSFLDYHGVSSPQPRTRDSLLTAARSNYATVANKAGETAAYPGDWLFKQWSDSDLKAWSDQRGIPTYQGTKRNQLIANVRRNSRVASNNLSAWSASASSTASSATQAVADAVFDTWSDSQLKKWADERGYKVPQGSKRNELLALVRRQNALLSQSATSVASSASSYYGAATSSASNEYAKATNDAAIKLEYLQSAFFSYVDWAKSQVGLAASTVSAAGVSASYAAQKSASSVSGSASSAGSSVSSSASKAAQKAYDAATEKAHASARAAKDYVKEEL